MSTRRTPFLLAVVLALLVPATAGAQSANNRARAMIRSAMEDYQNLDIDAAMHRLQEALRLCTNNNACSPSRTAEVHMAIGTVAIGGQNDNNRGISEFADALRLDANAIPDPELTTPEITAAFNQAQQRAGSGGASSGNAGGNTTTHPGGGHQVPVQHPVQSGGTSGGGGGGTMLHTPAPEQLQNTPLPVFVDPNGTEASHVTVHYRGLGMTGYADLEMQHVGNGYGAEIPCGQVIEPYVEYYVTAADDNGNVMASVGSPQAPTRVNIVGTRTQPAPFLPGRMPPEQCGEECPPGMSGPECRHGGSGRGDHQLGDPCETNNQCAEGLHCQEGACATGEAGGNAHPDQQYRVAFDVGGGFGAAFLPPPTAAMSTLPTYAENGHYTSDPSMPPDLTAAPTCGPPDDSGNPTLNCLPASNISTGFAWAGFLYFGARVRIIDRLMVGVSLRWQPDSAGGPLPAATGTNDVGDEVNNSERRRFTLASLFIGGRIYYAVTSPGWARNGLTFAPFIGTGFGQIETRPPVSDGPPSAHIVSGLNNFHVGAHVEYGFANYVHVGGDVTFEFMVPTFLFVTDIQATVGVHF